MMGGRRKYLEGRIVRFRYESGDDDDEEDGIGGALWSVCCVFLTFL
jgi:hypothetical protein